MSLASQIGPGGKLIPDAECLRGVIKHVPDCRAEAARLLWDSGSHIEDCIVLIEHVPLYADRAAERLLSFKPEPSYLDCIFEHVSNMHLRKQAAYYILHHNRGNSRCAKIVLEVPDYAVEAREALLCCGPFSLYDLRAIWQCADESVRPEQWAKFVENTHGSHSDIEEALMDDSLVGLQELAWVDFISRVKDKHAYYRLLKFPHLRERVWPHLKGQDLPLEGDLESLITNAPDMDELWAELDEAEEKIRQWTLYRLMTSKEVSDITRQRAKTRYFAEDPMPSYWLHGVLHIPTFRKEAAAILLAGKFVSRPT